MQTLELAEHYTRWHYGRAYVDMYRVWANLYWFIFHFFSVSTLLRTLFQPWKRMDEGYSKGFDPGGWISTFFVNIVMRIVGMMVRLILISAGLVCALILVLAEIVWFALWTVMPAFISVLIVLGLYLLIHG